MDRKAQVEIARRIKECRLKQDISQQDLARALGYKDQSMISKIESGSVDLPTTKLSQIAHFFDMPIEYFLGVREIAWHSSVIEDYHNARTFDEKKQIVDSSDGVDPSVAYDFYIALHNSEITQTASENIAIRLSAHETALILAYRSRPAMQTAVDTLLGITSEAAKSKNA